MMNDSPPDPELIENARRDPDAFAALYRHYLTPVYRYLYRRVGNVHDAEDLTTQVFMDALDGLVKGRFQRNGCFPAWLFTIARRRSVDFHRQRPASPLTDIPSAEPALLAALEKQDDLKRLTALLAQLDPEKQEILRLRFSAQLSFAEIALIEGKNEAAIKMALYRTLEWLRAHWEAGNG